MGCVSRTAKNFIFRVFPLLPFPTQHNCSQKCSTEGLGDVATGGGLSIYTSGFGFPELQQEGIWRFSSVYSFLSDCCEAPAFSILHPHPEAWNTHIHIQPCVTDCRARWLSLLEAGENSVCQVTSFLCKTRVGFCRARDKGDLKLRRGVQSPGEPQEELSEGQQCCFGERNGAAWLGEPLRQGRYPRSR